MTALLLCLFFGMEGKVERVSNPHRPGPQTMIFEEDLRFGAEDGDEYLWIDGQISTTFTVDSRGHFFVSDVKNSRILEFDDQGTFVDVFGKRGEGPGEYQNLYRFEIMKDGSALGFDFLQGTSKFSYYDHELKFTESKTIHGRGYSIYLPTFSPDGRWFYAWYFSFDADTATTVFKTGIFNRDLDLVRPMSENPWPTFDPNKFNDPNFWAGYLAKQFDGIINRGTDFARFLPHGNVVIANSKKYQFQIWSPDLKQARLQIEKDYDPIPITEEEVQALVDFVEETIFEQVPQAKTIVTPNVIRRALEQAKLPKWHNPVPDILPMEDGGLLVLHQTHMGEGTFVADIFNEKGRCVGRATSPGRGIYDLFGTRARFQNGFFYAMEKNEEGDNQIVRYRYRLGAK